MEALVTIIIAIVVLFAAVMTAVFWLAHTRAAAQRVPKQLGCVPSPPGVGEFSSLSLMLNFLVGKHFGFLAGMTSSG